MEVQRKPSNLITTLLTFLKYFVSLELNLFYQIGSVGKSSSNGLDALTIGTLYFMSFFGSRLIFYGFQLKCDKKLGYKTVFFK